MARAKKPPKPKKPKPERIDGLSPVDVEKIRKAIRQVWSWSYPRRLCLQRATDATGFYRCESCRAVTPKIFVDHVARVGDVDAGFIARLFCPSSGLQALCKPCHAVKTTLERKEAKK